MQRDAKYDHANFIRIAPDVKLGRGVAMHSFVNLYGCEIGDETKIGAFVEIQKDVVIGKRCKIQSHSFICSGVTIEDGVFIGHGVVFINDRYPAAVHPDGRMIHPSEWECIPTRVCSRASIGSNVTVLCGVTIGAGARVGAGAVVVKNVPPGATVAGNPARILRKPQMPI